MLSLVTLLAAASMIAAQDATTTTATTAAAAGGNAGTTDADIEKVRETLPECKARCAPLACARREVTDKTACRTDCDAKDSACRTAVEKFVQDRIAANADAFKARLAEIIKNNSNVENLTVEEAKTKCNGLCDARTSGDKLTACKDICSKITDVRSGLQAAAALLQAAARAKYDELVAANPNDPNAAAVKAAADKLRDAVALQRAFLQSTRSTIAAALDDRVAAIQKARADRKDAVQRAKDAIKSYKDKLAAATTDEEKAQIKADAKAQLDAAVAKAKQAFKDARAQIKDDKKALIQKVLDAKKTRKANRKVIIADFKALIGSLQDLKTAVKDVDPDAEVVAATKKRATGATVVLTCEQGDDVCYAAFNSAIAGFVAADGDVTITETDDAELNETEPSLPADEVPSSTTAASDDKKKTNSAASLLLGVAAVACAIVSMF